MSNKSVWNGRYDKEGAIWGMGISPVATRGVDQIKPSADLIEIGIALGPYSLWL